MSDDDRKTHVYRIIGKTKDENGDTVDATDVWIDLQRIEQFVTVEGAGFNYQKTFHHLEWYDDEDGDVPNNRRKTRVLKIIPPDENKDDPSVWFEVPLTEQIEILDADQRIFRSFENGVENERREVEVRRVTHFDTPYDDDPDLDEGGIIRDYHKTEGTEDEAQYLDVEIPTESASLDHDQLTILKLDNADLIDASREPETTYAEGEINPPWRLDPLQNIVNVQLGQAVWVPRGVYWSMPAMPVINGFSFVCAMYVPTSIDNLDFNYLNWGRFVHRDGVHTDPVESEAVDKGYSLISPSNFNLYNAMGDGNAYACGRYVSCIHRPALPGGGNVFPDGTWFYEDDIPPFTTCGVTVDAAVDVDPITGAPILPPPVGGWNGTTYQVEGGAVSYVHGALNDVDPPAGAWNVVMFSANANGDITVAVNSTDNTATNYRNESGDELSPIAVAGNNFDFYGGRPCDFEGPRPVRPTVWGPLAAEGGPALMGNAFFNPAAEVVPTGGGGVALAGYRLWDQFIDWTDASNRQKIAKINGRGELIFRKPKVSIEAFGEPMLAFDGGAKSFATNQGTLGGGFKIAPIGGELKNFSQYPTKLGVPVRGRPTS